MTPVDVARRVPIASLVARDCKVVGDYAYCPFHGPERTPSLHIHRKGNFFKCFGCGVGGDPIAWVRRTRGLDFESAVKELSHNLYNPERARRASGARWENWGQPARPSSPSRDRPLSGETEGRLHQYIPVQGAEPVRRGRAEQHGANPATGAYIAKLWLTADAPAIAELYLDSRGLRVRSKPLPEALRGHRAVWCKEARECRPATLAAVTDDSGALLAIQRIWCSDRLETVNGKSPPKGTLATDLRKPKKHLGSPRDGAVRLCDPKETLGLTEGVEDAIAVRQIYSLPCWAMVGGGRLGALAVPEITRHVVIFGDADAAGRALAEKAAREYDERPGLSASIVYPQGAKDFCEELNG